MIKKTLTKETLAKVEYLLPRLKYSVLPSKIIRWLENFEEEEIDLAIDLLSVYEYIPFNEFMFRLNNLLSEILKDLPKEEKIIILPYGKVGKSGTLVTYPLKHTKAFKKRENNILLTHDYEKIDNPSQYNFIVFLDDFIGSGKTFIKEFTKKNHKENSIEKWVLDNNIENIFILASIIMAEGEDLISNKYPNINIKAEKRNKIFNKTNSPLNLFGNLENIKDLSLKYGKTLKVYGFKPFCTPFGYDESESLISYFHCTPNNTLPIIWAKYKTWYPLFPREASIRMDEAREFKKEIAFYIGICNRLGINIITGKSIIEKIKDKYVRKRVNNTKQDHSVVALVYLKSLGYDNLIISHLLGITREELKIIYHEGKMKNLINVNYELTIKGYQFLNELKKKTKKEKIREESEKNLKPKDVLYIPKMFNGLT